MSSWTSSALTSASEVDLQSPPFQNFRDLQQRLLDHYGVRAESRFIQAGHRLVHVLDAGSGEPVVFFHGGDGEAVNWAPFMAEMQDHVRLIGVDRPGFGLTGPFDYRSVDLRTHAADFVESVLDGLGLAQATLIGGSMGGFFALSAALAHPQRVRRLVLIGLSVGLAREAGDDLKRMSASPEAAMAMMDLADSLEGLHGMYQHLFQVPLERVPELYFESRLAGLRLPGAKQTWALLLQRLIDQDGFRPEVCLLDELPGMRTPTLVLWGERDLAPADLGRAAVARMGDGTFHVMQGTGHFPFLESPHETARQVRAFLAAHE